MSVSIGIRELRDTLSKQIAAVREGETIIVTDHGKPVARIVPVTFRTTLEQLIAEGKVTPARMPKTSVDGPAAKGVTISDLIADQRR